MGGSPLSLWLPQWKKRAQGDTQVHPRQVALWEPLWFYDHRGMCRESETRETLTVTEKRGRVYSQQQPARRPWQTVSTHGAQVVVSSRPLLPDRTRLVAESLGTWWYAGLRNAGPHTKVLLALDPAQAEWDPAAANHGPWLPGPESLFGKM